MIKEVKQHAAIKKAKKELEEEKVAKAVKLYKEKLKERDVAETVLKNIDRELEDLAEKIEQGNI